MDRLSNTMTIHFASGSQPPIATPCTIRELGPGRQVFCTAPTWKSAHAAAQPLTESPIVSARDPGGLMRVSCHAPREATSSSILCRIGVRRPWRGNPNSDRFGKTIRVMTTMPEGAGAGAELRGAILRGDDGAWLRFRPDSAPTRRSDTSLHTYSKNVLTPHRWSPAHVTPTPATPRELRRAPSVWPSHSHGR